VKEVEETVGSDQTQSQVENLALQRAKRLAVEEAGTYISSLTVVKNFQLEKDEVTALASGVVKTKSDDPVPRVDDNKVIHIKVKATIEVDTGILDKQIQEIMKEKGTLKKLEEERRKVKELEDQLANLKSSEMIKLQELNAQTIAIEREREKQRLFREEQILKARGEINKAEAERLAKDREIQARTNQILDEQERARKKENDAIAKEQDRLRRAQLESEQRWSEIARKTKLKQAEWGDINETLSLKQTIEDAKQLKKEIVNLSQRLDLQFEENKDNLRKVFEQQRDLIKPLLPPVPEPKGDFEKTQEYENRLAKYNAAKVRAENECQNKKDKLSAELDYRIAKATLDYFVGTIKILKGFVDRMESIQAKTFVVPEEKISVDLGKPDPDKNRIPMTVEYGSQKWELFWGYNEASREKAIDFLRTKQFIEAIGTFKLEEQVGAGYQVQSFFKKVSLLPELLRGKSELYKSLHNAKLFQHGENNDIVPKLIKVLIAHPGMGVKKEYPLGDTAPFSEIASLSQIIKSGRTEAQRDASEKRAAWVGMLTEDEKSKFSELTAKQSDEDEKKDNQVKDEEKPKPKTKKKNK
jgi:hypothetical protein